MEAAKIHETDVLIIGAAIAGMRAAIEAHDKGAKVTLINKGVLGRDGAATWMAGHAISTVLYEPDTYENHMKDTIEAGKYLNNQDLVATLLPLTSQGAREMVKWGTRYDKLNDGRLLQILLPGHGFPRSLMTPIKSMYPGPEYSRSLVTQIKKREIPVFEDTLITDLLSNDGKVVGALGLDLKTGEFHVFKAKCTMLATGGASFIYRFTTNGNGTFGDGLAMAYRAGAKLMDMEFQQFMPAAALWPPSIFGSITFYGLLVTMYGHYLNRQGERFMERYYPVTKDWSKRDETARAITSEIQRGASSRHGGVYLAINHQPRNLIDYWLEEMKDDPIVRRLTQSGVDLHHDALEVAPASHYTQGGCHINTKCETGIDNLYAIGEVAGGVDGADRLAGNALAFCLAMGIKGGAEAAHKAAGTDIPKIDEDQVAELKRQITGPLERAKGIKPAEIQNKVQDMMGLHCAFQRSQKGLEEGLRGVAEARQKINEMATVNKSNIYNMEWLQAINARNITQTAEIMMRSALMRTETRGAHERTDYPQEDHEWLKNIITQKVGNEMTFTTIPVALNHIKPKGGK